MSDFLGRVGRITEWVVISNLENRAVNAAVDKAQDWWKHRKDKHDSHSASASPIPPPPATSQHPPSYTQFNSTYPPVPPQYSPQQASYMPQVPFAQAAPSMGYNQLLLTANYVEGLNNIGPLNVILECNYQRFQTSLGQYQNQFMFPIYQFDYDQLFVWIQSEYQQQTVAHGEIPIRILLNNNKDWTSQQQRWIPLRDNFNGPAGQLVVTIEYKPNYSAAPQTSMPAPPPYPYYS